MRTIAWALAACALGGLIVLAVAGVSGATAVLVTAAAVVGMIVLGNMIGGRRTPDRAPYGASPRPEGSEEAEP